MTLTRPCRSRLGLLLHSHVVISPPIPRLLAVRPRSLLMSSKKGPFADSEREVCLVAYCSSSFPILEVCSAVTRRTSAPRHASAERLARPKDSSAQPSQSYSLLPFGGPTPSLPFRLASETFKYGSHPPVALLIEIAGYPGQTSCKLLLVASARAIPGTSFRRPCPVWMRFGQAVFSLRSYFAVPLDFILKAHSYGS